MKECFRVMRKHGKSQPISLGEVASINEARNILLENLLQLNAVGLYNLSMNDDTATAYDCSDTRWYWFIERTWK